MILNEPAVKAGGVSGLSNCLRFTSAAEFTLKVYDSAKHWDGTLEWTDGQNDWAVWDGTTTLQSAGGFLAVRGSGNTIIARDLNYRWVLTGNNIRCDGNIETLLDYQTVASGMHPTMGNYCYSNLFRGCASLTSAPDLPATTMKTSCYSGMFNGCTALTTAPALPATTLSEYCYSGMFNGCTSLTSAPTLPTTTLARNCYSGMFNGCTRLTSAPALPATTLADYCYSEMFKDCTSLTSAPALPATALSYYCYQYMFQGCTSLTRVPALPATTLRAYCYRYMFYRCANIKLSTTQTGDYQYEYRVPQTGEGTTATDALASMFTYTGGTFTGTPTINTTYYTDHPPVAA
ncbi:MAG: leucine-rich repeat protein [Clostridia bacterium]|nr:leucine-rich repeat protein [Clostridia bacterium]